MADLTTIIPQPAVDELISKVWPYVECEYGPGAWEDDTELERLAACLFAYKGDDLHAEYQGSRSDAAEEGDDDDGAYGVDSSWLAPSGPLWKYARLGVSKETISIVARFHDRGTAGSCRLVGQHLKEGYAYEYDAEPECDSWTYKPLPPERVVDVQARTLTIAFELTSGGPDQCMAPPPGLGPYPPAAEAVSRLVATLRPQLRHLPAALLANDDLVLAVLLTSLNACLAHQSLQRALKKGRLQGVRVSAST